MGSQDLAGYTSFTLHAFRKQLIARKSSNDYDVQPQRSPTKHRLSCFNSGYTGQTPWSASLLSIEQ
eukprot:1506237-Amphidinium_carterae.1